MTAPVEPVPSRVTLAPSGLVATIDVVGAGVGGRWGGLNDLDDNQGTPPRGPTAVAAPESDGVVTDAELDLAGGAGAGLGELGALWAGHSGAGFPPLVGGGIRGRGGAIEGDGGALRTGGLPDERGIGGADGCRRGNGGPDQQGSPRGQAHDRNGREQPAAHPGEPLLDLNVHDAHSSPSPVARFACRPAHR